ncbi:MAG TPA: DUF4118 domain-containing protein, partial [Opitutus sp.]|nr:DUF4118 domain-containing protein [Opitutus sp.]
MLALCGAVYARQGLSSWLGETPFAFLLPAVFVSAWFGGTWVGVGATLVGVLIAAAGFPEPFVFNHPSEWTRLLLFTTNAAFATGICAILHHVVHTSRASANEAARNFEIMANNAPVLIWSTDADGRCRFVNHNWLAFTGRPLERGSEARRPGQLHPGDAGRYETVSQE